MVSGFGNAVATVAPEGEFMGVQCEEARERPLTRIVYNLELMDHQWEVSSLKQPPD